MLSLRSGVRLRVAESGPVGGTTVVLLSGWGASLYMFRHALDVLPRQGMRVLAVDLRGFGLSERPIATGSYRLEAYMGDVAALLDDLDADRVILGGQSMGGGVALHYALRASSRLRGVVLINPVGLVPIPLVNAARALPRGVITTAGRAALPRWLIGFILRRLAYGDPSLVTERTIDEYWAPTQLPGYVHAARTSIGEFDWSPIGRERLGALRIPALVILGRSDRLVRSAGDAARSIGCGVIHELVGGHCVQEEQPDEVYGLVSDFARRIASNDTTS
jgi:pimeloyl-ACP methyl ester carboxylesterase